MIYLEEEFREPVKYELSKKGYDEASERYVNDLVHIIGDNRKFKDKLPVLMLSGGVDSMMLGCILKQEFGLEDSITVGCVQDTKDIKVSEDTASQLGINQKQVFVTFEEILDTMKDCMHTDDHFLRGANITTTFDLVYYLTFKLCLQKVNVEIENTDLIQGDGADTLLGSISTFMYRDVPCVMKKYLKEFNIKIDADQAKTIIKQKYYADKIDPSNTKHKGSGQLFVEISEELGANAIMAFKHPDTLRWVNDLEYKFSRPDRKIFPKKVIEYLGYDPDKVNRTIMEKGTGIYDAMKIILELMAASPQSGKSPNSAVKELIKVTKDVSFESHFKL